MHIRISRIVLTAAVCIGTARGAAERPNIVVFFTDDHGYADMACQGVVSDIRTPHVDALAAAGVRMSSGYSTAPQCVPSRGGLMTGRFQSRFGLESNASTLDGFNAQTTLAQRLKDAGYATAMFGKWHLGPTAEISRHGFDHVFAQNANRPFSANIDLDGRDRPMGDLKNELYHIDGCSRAAASIIERYHDRPFFLYVAYRAPHVPLDAPEKYLSRFPGPMPERRRQALAMLSAVDDGVGLVTDTLRRHGLEEKTLVFYIGDNGAPLKIHKADIPGGGPGWDGSLNDPLNGEKGMLTEGGIRVPFVVSWKGMIPGGQVYSHPVTSLDVAATAAALAGIRTKPGDLDGVNLIPHLRGEIDAPPHEAVMWRWIAQSAIREGKWKLLRGGDREYLFDLDADKEETTNLAARHTEIVERLRSRLQSWTDELNPPGLTAGSMAGAWDSYFNYYLDGKPAPPLRKKHGGVEDDEAEDNAPPRRRAGMKAFQEPDGAETGAMQGWVGRNCSIAGRRGVLEITAEDAGAKANPFIVKQQMNLETPASVVISARSEQAGELGVAWRLQGQKEFGAGQKSAVRVAGGGDWADHEFRIPDSGTVIQLRLHVPGGTTSIRGIDIRPEDGVTKGS